MLPITVVTTEEKYIEDVDRIRRTFMNSKFTLCCIPAGVGSASQNRKEYDQCPDLKNVCGVAIHPEKGPVGFIQLVLEGMPCQFHTAKAKEAYVAYLAVDEGCQGMGVGSALLEWSENVAKERGCTYMSLEVIYGNPAIRLYERKGYEIKPSPLWKKIAWFIPVLCLIGPVIFPRGSSNYCSLGQTLYMEKQLE